MPRRSQFFNLSHDQHILRKSLDWLDEEIFECELMVLGVCSCLAEETVEIVIILRKRIHQRVWLVEIIEILEINLKERDFFLSIGENDLIMRVMFWLGEDRGEKQLIQLSDFVNVGEEGVGLLVRDDFFLDKAPLEIWYDNTEIPNVFFLSFHQFPYDIFPFG